LTTCIAASSAGKPRQDFAAISEDRASHMPSEAIISLPPAFDSYNPSQRVSFYPEQRPHRLHRNCNLCHKENEIIWK